MLVTPASAIAFRLNTSYPLNLLVSWSNLALVRSISMWRGQLQKLWDEWQINLSCLSTLIALLSLLCSFPLVSVELCCLFLRSIPCSAMKESALGSLELRYRGQSPAEMCIPFVASTSNTCPFDTSNVPPPRSYTRIFCDPSALSSP